MTISSVISEDFEDGDEHQMRQVQSLPLQPSLCCEFTFETLIFEARHTRAEE